MIRRMLRLALTGLPLILLGGCADTLYLKAFKTPGADRVPLKIALFPFLTTSDGSVGRPIYHQAREQGMASLKFDIKDSTIDIVPPIGFNLAITQDSQILTDLVTTGLLSRGFALQQLPVEMRETKDQAARASQGFYISLALLSELKEKYGFQAIALGDCFFTYDTYSRQTKATLAHLKVVDIQTLDVLAEVSTPYNQDGMDMNQVCDQMSGSLAGLAGISPKPKT